MIFLYPQLLNELFYVRTKYEFIKNMLKKVNVCPTHLLIMQQSQIQKTKYFFEFIPINLNRIAKKLKRKIDENAEFKFTLYLQGTKIVQSKEWLRLHFVQNAIKCSKCYLDFCVTNFNPDFYTSFTLKVILKQPPKIKYENDPQKEQICNIEQVISQLGSFQLDPGVYIDIFKDDRKTLFQQNIQISSDYSLDYQVYIQKTRFSLQKVIRDSRGGNSEANILASAFKKNTGKKKVRYVELNESGQRSVKEQEFKKSKKMLISSLKKSGSKYVPQKTVEPDSNSSRNATPIKPEKDINQNESNLIQPSHSSLLKSVSKAQNDSSSFQTNKEANSGYISPRIQRGDQFNRSLIEPHSQLDHSFVYNRLSYEKFLERLILGIFWGTALFLLYLSMSPSRKV